MRSESVRASLLLRAFVLFLQLWALEERSPASTETKGEVKLDREPPWSDIDTQFTNIMKKLLFNQEEIKESTAPQNTTALWEHIESFIALK